MPRQRIPTVSTGFTPDTDADGNKLESGVLSFEPVYAIPATLNICVVREDDDTEVGTPEVTEDGRVEVRIPGWSRYCMAMN